MIIERVLISKSITLMQVNILWSENNQKQWRIKWNKITGSQFIEQDNENFNYPLKNLIIILLYSSSVGNPTEEPKILKALRTNEKVFNNLLFFFWPWLITNIGTVSNLAMESYFNVVIFIDQQEQDKSSFIRHPLFDY